MNKCIYGILIAFIARWKWLNRSYECQNTFASFVLSMKFDFVTRFYERSIVKIQFRCDNTKNDWFKYSILWIHIVIFSHSLLCIQSHNIVAKVIKNNDSNFMWWFFYLLKKWRKNQPVVNELDYSHKMRKYFRCFMTFKHQTFSSFWQFHGEFRIYSIWINAKHYSSAKFAQSACKSNCAFILVASLYFDM